MGSLPRLVGQQEWDLLGLPLVPQTQRLFLVPAQIGHVAGHAAALADEAGIADFLARGLEAEGYGVTVAADGIAGERLALSPDTDLVVLDRMLPGRDGIEVLASIRRSKPMLPVILLTARADVADRVEGLDLGATDYVTKPFAFDELVARIHALVRRRHHQKSSIIKVGPLTLDTSSRTLRLDDVPVELSPRDYTLLHYLLLRRGKVVTREEIETHLYDDSVDPMSNVVESAVCSLRKKINVPNPAQLIHTRHGLGYVLKAESE